MKRICKLTAALGVLLAAGGLLAAEKLLKLPAAQTTGGKSIMECLTLRRSTKAFVPGKRLDFQQISNILYAANGINRRNGKLTIPTARNLQNQSVYAVLPDGVYIYKPADNLLELVRAGQFMDKCGRQLYCRNASMILIYAANMAAVGGTNEGNAMCAGTHAGSSAQNVYLYAASENLGTVICGNFDEKKLSRMLRLPAAYKVIYIQPVGFPAQQ